MKSFKSKSETIKVKPCMELETGNYNTSAPVKSCTLTFYKLSYSVIPDRFKKDIEKEILHQVR